MTPVEWKISDRPVPYDEALTAMNERVTAIGAGQTGDLVWLLEHPALYTAGTSARPEDLLDPGALPVYQTGRGGQYTYHGPGQRVGYLMLDLNRRGRDLRAFVRQLEAWIIATLASFGIEGGTREGRVGVWVVDAQGREAKIAALGLRVRRWITLHGISLNVAPELEHYQGIVPCGIREHGVTSLAALGVDATMAEVDAVLKRTFDECVA
jgi:lipoyl(octanoyl) transferase